MAFTVKIIDNDTNEVLVDEPHAVAIVGAVANQEDTNVLAAASRCSVGAMIGALEGAKRALQEFKENAQEEVALWEEIKKVVARGNKKEADDE